jgi:hypothetical protein
MGRPALEAHDGQLALIFKATEGQRLTSGTSRHGRGTAIALHHPIAVALRNKQREVAMSQITFIFIAAFVTVFTTLAPGAAVAASIDCEHRHSFVEKAICASPNLIRLDNDVANLYAAAAEVALRPDRLSEEQRQWLRETRNVCGDVGCLRRAHEVRLIELSVLIERRNWP